jgi:hypothetical protein
MPGKSPHSFSSLRDRSGSAIAQESAGAHVTVRESNRSGELKELIANLVWEDQGFDLRPDRFVRVDDAGYGLADEFDRLVSESYDLGHDRFRQGSLRFQMLRARE